LTESEAGAISKTERAREPVRRVFFALWPDAALRTALARATHKAVSACGGRPVPAQSLHVTLAFLGSVLESRTSELEAIAGRVAASLSAGAGTNAAPPQLIFDRIEHWQRLQMICATVGAESGEAVAVVGSLADALKREAVAAGFAPDLKPFRAHVTVARKVARPTHSLDMHSVPWSCTEFALIESRTAAGGAIYSVINSWALDTRRNY
jgi:RNA 2',3'-cyclic 3'-phosphodiesterase